MLNCFDTRFGGRSTTVGEYGTVDCEFDTGCQECSLPCEAELPFCSDDYETANISIDNIVFILCCIETMT
jgi:hypothetical protein